MSEHDDDMPEVTGERRSDNRNFRVRESDAVPDEGMPPVNRKKNGNKAFSYMLIALAVFFGLLLIFKVNSPGSKAKKQEPGNAAVTNTLPPIDFPTTTPPPAAPVANAAPPINPPASAAAIGGAHQGDVYHPPVKGPNGKVIVHWSDRKLVGDVVVKSPGQKPKTAGSEVGGPGGRVPDYDKPASATGENTALSGPRSGGSDNLGSRLTGTPTPSVKASLLRNRDFLLAKGTSLDCTMDVAIDTALPGITSCTLNNDVYSDNNRTLLMEKGTQLVGEQQGNVKRGQARVFALWTRAKTPQGVVINLNSPGADSLGRSGLDGWVDNHFIDRFGAAILMSFIQSSLKYAVASQERNGATTVIGDTADSGEGVVSKILDSTINIPPTILKNQGDHINIMVARDLDFSSVYALEAN